MLNRQLGDMTNANANALHNGLYLKLQVNLRFIF